MAVLISETAMQCYDTCVALRPGLSAADTNCALLVYSCKEGLQPCLAPIITEKITLLKIKTLLEPLTHSRNHAESLGCFCFIQAAERAFP